MTREEKEREISAVVREKADYHRAPPSLAADVLAALPANPASAPRARFSARTWQFWLAQGAAFAGVAVLTFAATVAWLRPGEDERHAEDILAAHVRATLGQHTIDVASSDQHTVKPWLSTRLPYSPPVADLSAQGFELTGARIDRAGGRPVAVLVYKRRQHTIDAYVWPAREAVGGIGLSRDGFQLERFGSEGWTWWLVSDLNKNELDDLARLLARGAP
ncbi:MAG TPA: anti-sigma factor [Burkholderiales bacterium]|jgi:anti-sigma factor RsiW|nr:anti-sigma factor [Burkholderiales bacterium]